MKSIVVYQSSTGFTRRYAEWISQDAECELLDIKDFNIEKAKDYECIIFGGWIMGNVIMGFDKVKNIDAKKLIVFAVGALPSDEDVIRNIKEKNNIGEIKFYYFTGGMHFEKLKLPVRMMLKALKKNISHKEDKTRQEKFMEKYLGTSFDNTRKEYIVPLINNLEKIN